MHPRTVAILVGSILLLMRKNAGRVLTILALVAFIAASITSFVKVPPIVHDASSSSLTAAPSGIAYSATGAAFAAEAVASARSSLRHNPLPTSCSAGRTLTAPRD